MDTLLFLLPAKLFDWPTVLIGLVAGLVAWSWRSAAVLILVAAVAAELTIMFVRGWPIRPSWLAIEILAVLPWTVAGHVLRRLALALLHRQRGT